MERDIQEVLLSQEQIQSKVKELAAQLMEEYHDKNPIFVGVLKGVVMFYADFLKNFTENCEMDFMWISSYSGTESKTMQVRQDLSKNITTPFRTPTKMGFLSRYSSISWAASSLTLPWICCCVSNTS